MKKCFLLLCCLSFAGLAWADELTRALQQKLKDQGFYYGDVNGQPGAETAAALRRFQIRFGLRVTGTADAGTLRALGLGEGAAPNGAGNPHPKTPETPPPVPPADSGQSWRNSPEQQRSKNAPSARPEQNQRRGESPSYEDADPRERDPYNYYEASPTPPFDPGTSGPARGALFAGTVYERAPRQLQENVLYMVQGLLARRGFYDGDLDGQPGPATTQAIRRFQHEEGLPLTGWLDSQTLGELGVLPGQRNGPRSGDEELAPPVPPARQPVYRGVWIR